MDLSSKPNKSVAGVLPFAWSVSELAQVSLGITVGFVGSMSHLFRRHGIPLLRGQNVMPGALDLSNLKYISPETHRLWKKSALEPGDVVIVRVGYPGTAATIPPSLGPANAASLVVVRPQPSKLSAEFLTFVLNSVWGKEQMKIQLVGGAQQVFNIGSAATFVIPLPPVTEQRVIAAALGDVDALISSLVKLIAKKRELKQAVMQQLLTGKKRLPGFTGAWKREKLRSKTQTISKGTTPTSLGLNFTVSGVNFVKIESIDDDGRIDPQKLGHICSRTDQLLKRSQLKLNDILFSIAGALGKTALISIDILPANTNQGLAFIRLRNEAEVDPSFLLNALRADSIRKHVEAINVQGAQANLSLENIRDFEISFPPIEEQREIAKVLMDMEGELSALRCKIAKILKLKDGMMQELLTGKTRLIGVTQ